MNKTTLLSIISGLALGLLSFQAQALPFGCEPTGFVANGSSIELNSDLEKSKQSLYLFNNTSRDTIFFEHADKHHPLSPGWKSQLDGNRYSAFALDGKDFTLNCAVQRGGEISSIPCQDVLEVCRYPNVRFSLAFKGTYWLSESKDYSQVLRDMRKKQIKIYRKKKKKTS